MNTVKLCSSLFLISLVAFTGCKKGSTGPSATIAVNTTVEQPEPVGGETRLAETRYFTGSIGSSLGLQMKLTRQGQQLSGSYFYKKIGTSIDLRGTIDEHNNVVIDEFDSSGKQTGTFKGLWLTSDDGIVKIAGNWTKPGGQTKTAFSLHEEPIQFSGGVEIVQKQIKDSNKKLKYEITAEYPELSGKDPNHDKFNRDVRVLVQRKVATFKKEMSEPDESVELPKDLGSFLEIGYQIALAQDDVISLQFDVGSYYRGAAHPNSYSEVVNYALKNGRHLKLGDLFKPGSKYLATIASYSIKELKKLARGKDSILDDDWIEKGAAAKSENYESWTITKKGLAITFDAYQVGPYAAGPQEVVVPYSVLKEVINPEGVLAQFVK